MQHPCNAKGRYDVSALSSVSRESPLSLWARVSPQIALRAHAKKSQRSREIGPSPRRGHRSRSPGLPRSGYPGSTRGTQSERGPICRHALRRHTLAVSSKAGVPRNGRHTVIPNSQRAVLAARERGLRVASYRRRKRLTRRAPTRQPRMRLTGGNRLTRRQRIIPKD
jgi:hypothetical protein